MGVDAAAGVAIRDRTISLEEAKQIWDDYVSIIWTPSAAAGYYDAQVKSREEPFFLTNADKYPGGVNPDPGSVPVITEPALYYLTSPGGSYSHSYITAYYKYSPYLNSIGQATPQVQAALAVAQALAQRKIKPAQVESRKADENIITNSTLGKKFLGE